MSEEDGQLGIKDKLIRKANIPYFILIILGIVLIFSIQYNFVVGMVIIFLSILLIFWEEASIEPKRYMQVPEAVERIHNSKTGEQFGIPSMTQIAYSDTEGRANSKGVKIDDDHFYWTYRDQNQMWNMVVGRLFYEPANPFGKYYDNFIANETVDIQALTPQDLHKNAIELIKDKEGHKELIELANKLGLGAAVYALRRALLKRSGRVRRYAPQNDDVIDTNANGN